MKNMKPNGKGLKGCIIFHILFLLLCVTSGCGNKFFDPTQVGRFDHTPAVSVILDQLGPGEEMPLAWEQGVEPRAADIIPNISDYTLMPGDVIGIDIPELLSQGITYTKEFEVSETGKISIPEVGVIQVTGKTETQIEEMIKSILSPTILVDPSVHVTLLQSQQRAYSIQGDGVPRPDRYPLPRFPLSLLEALAMAGSANQTNVSYVYIARKEKKTQRNLRSDNSEIKDFRAIQSAYNLKEPITYDTTKSRPASNNSRISSLVVSSTEMSFDRATGGYSRNNQNWRNSSGRLGRNAYQFSDMGSESNNIENPVSVDEVLKRMTGQPASVPQEPARNETPDRNVQTQPEQPAIESPGQEGSTHIEWMYQNGEWVPVEVESKPSPGTVNVNPNEGTTSIPGTTNNVPDTTQDTSGEHVEWILQGGRYVPVPVGQAPTNTTQNNNNIPAINVPEPEFNWTDQEDTETRLIKIPIDRLLAGDERYDIIIKPGDSILVPRDTAGYYFVMGNVNHPGRVEMTGGKITLKQAIATVGNLGPLAWPERCEIIRRIGDNKEKVVRVDLEKIFNGEQPDIYIKPNDVINVGTHATSIWRAVLRNSFRAAYGFGFVYDRNFAIDDYYSNPWFD